MNSPVKMSRAESDPKVYGLIVLVALLGYGFLLLPGRCLYSPHSDVVTYHLAAKTVLYRSWQGGEGLPFWRADEFAGYPAMTNPQALYTYPLHALFFFFKPVNAIGPTFLLHFLLVAVSYYLLGIVLELKLLPRLLMAIAGLFHFKLIIAVYAGWLAPFAGLSFIPLIFVTLFYFLKEPCLRRALVAAVIGLVCVHAGHLQIIYFASWFALSFFVICLVGWWREGESRVIIRTILLALLIVVLILAMWGYLWLPLVAERPLLSRSESSYATFLAGHAIRLSHLLTFLHPELLGTPLDGSYAGHELWEDVGYFGLIALMLAVCAAILGWRQRMVRYLAASWLISLVLAFDTPILRLLFHLLPGLSVFRCPSRILFLNSFFGIALAGIGVHLLLERFRAIQKRELAVGILLLGVMGGEGLYYVHRYLKIEPAEKVMPRSELSQLVEEAGDPFRVAPLGRATVNYGWAAPWNLQLITGYDGHNLRHYQTYLDILQTGRVREGPSRIWAHLRSMQRADLLDALNVKYVVSVKPLSAASLVQHSHITNHPRFVFYRGMSSGELFVYENQNFMSRAFWVEQVIEHTDEEAVVGEIMKQNLRTTAIVQDGSETRQTFAASPADRVVVQGASDGHLKLLAKASSERFLVISEVWHPGWKARMDGERLPLKRTNLALMGCWVPSGKHGIELDFHPLFFGAGLLLSVGGLLCYLIVLGVAIVTFRRSK